VADTAAVRRATAKIEHAVGDATPVGLAVDLGAHDLGGDPGRGEAADITIIREALTAGRALRIRYYTAGRDAVSQRTVDPMRLLIADGRSYLEAWCRRAEAVRLFRLDRVDDVVLLDEPAAPPPDAVPTDVSEGAFRARAEHSSAVLELAPEARWVAEYYPVEQVVELTGGRARVLLRYADPDWLVRLVLGLGGGARLLEPPELAEVVGERARAALAGGGGAG
jgi:proteasome accessory factor C